MSDTNEKAIAIIEKQLNPLISKAVKIEITSDDEQRAAGELLSQINKQSDALKKLKEGLTKPMNAALKAARALFAPREEKIEVAVDALRVAMGAYKRAADLKVAEAERKLADRVEKGTMKAETAVRKMSELEVAESHIETDSGSVKFRDVKRFEVMDIHLLPMEYHVADEVAIRKEMVAGRELAGVRYWTDSVPVNSR